MNEETGAGHWSDTVRNMAITAVQIASLLLILEHAGWKWRDSLRGLRGRFERWHRQQEFELFYQLVWSRRPKIGGDDE
jgi:hypothetical protein